MLEHIYAMHVEKNKFYPQWKYIMNICIEVIVLLADFTTYWFAEGVKEAYGIWVRCNSVNSQIWVIMYKLKYLGNEA